MFRFGKWAGVTLAFAAALLLARPASAFHGYHGGYHHHTHVYYGGYGYGWSGYSIGVPSYYPSYSRAMFSFWGSTPSYAPYSLFPASRVTYTSYYRPVVYRPWWRLHCLSHRPVVVSYSAPVVYSPVYYSYPSYSPVIAPVEPSCCGGGTVTDAETIHSVSLPSSVDRSALIASSVVDVRSPLTTPSIVLPRVGDRVGSSDASSARLVSVESTKTLLPQELLDATDAIFQAGEYSRAAAAYARLAVLYGESDLLTARRFAAQVAAGDCNQAAVIYEMSVAMQRPIAAADLPEAGLKGLYGSRHNERASHVDRLALAALENPNDPVPLAMVGTWLILDGQVERARPLLEKAAQLSGSTSNSELPASAPLLARTLKTE